MQLIEIEIEISSRIITKDSEVETAGFRDMNFRNIGLSEAILNYNIPFKSKEVLLFNMPDSPLGIKYVRKKSLPISFVAGGGSQVVLMIGQREGAKVTQKPPCE